MAREELMKKLSDAANEILGFRESLSIPHSIGLEYATLVQWFATLVKHIVNQKDRTSWALISDEKIERAVTSMTSVIQFLRSIESDRIRITDELVADAIKKIDTLQAKEMPWVQMLTFSFFFHKEKEWNEREANWKDFIKDVRAETLAAGAKEFTEDFKKEAEAQKKRARIWLGVAVSFGVFLIGFSAALMLGGLPSPESSGESLSWGTISWDAIYNIGGRLSILFVLFYATTWAGRMALVCFNLANTNKHRELSLRNLRAFGAASENDTVKDAIVVEAAQTVFGHIPAGFLGKAEPAIPQPILSRVVEIIRRSKES
ncbi:MAG: hypothetical protein OXU65_01285 [Deltaproteobacteria bacterium]|nr:hypothetical protein [Deltaproteobacteria bacterium]